MKKEKKIPEEKETTYNLTLNESLSHGSQSDLFTTFIAFIGVMDRHDY